MSSLPYATTKASSRVLILATTHWISTARLVMALDALGCKVDMVAPPNHPALKTGKVAEQYAYRPLLPLTALRRAIRLSRPDLVLLADELSFLLIEELAHWASVAKTPEADVVLGLLIKSFGSLDCLPLTRSRMALLSAAEAAGVSVPLSFSLRNRHDVQRVPQEMPGPWMLKADATWGGFGVRSASHPKALLPTWRGLQRPLNLLQSIKRGWDAQEWGHIRIWMRGDKRDVIVQQFVKGRERTGMAMAIRGEMSASVCFEVEEVRYANGPSSIVRVVEDDAITDSMRRVIKVLGITGFCGFDFMLDAKTDQRQLLEMNMRPTQLAHLPLGPGMDLCAALVRDVLGATDLIDRTAATDSSLIAMFPQEILRDPEGLRLGESFHDVPWSAPLLMEHAVHPQELPWLLTADPRWRGESVMTESASSTATFSGHSA